MRIRALSRPDSFFTLPPDAKVDPEVARHSRRNFTVNLLDQWNYPAPFVTSAVFVVGGLALLALRVREPRHIARPTSAI